jgi:hypothetical protein
MTLVVGTAFNQFGGALISDTRVTFATGGCRDMIRKAHPVGRCMAAGFAGSVAIGFALIQNLTANLRLPANAAQDVWEPMSVAREWSRIAKAIFDHAPAVEKMQNSRVLIVGIDPKGSGARLIRLAAPSFKPEFMRQGVRTCSIGTGASDKRIMRVVRPHVDIRSTPGCLLQGGIGLWAGALADYLGEETGTHLVTDVGRNFHVLTVEAHGFTLHHSGRKSLVDWQDEPIDLDPMPTVAATYGQFLELAKAEGLTAAAASC